jgi:hypothetical protein
MQELLNVKAAGTYSDHSALKGYPDMFRPFKSHHQG